MQKKIQLSLLSVALLSSLHAQEITLKPFQITSTAIATDELKSTDAVEVYTQEDIEKSHAKNIYEFLNTQTSITTLPSYGNPFSQLIDIRGYGSSNGNENILITINGKKMNNIDSVPQQLSAISPSSISKIEIIKSSGIVMGGDGANAGVINITTKKNNDKEITFALGTYGTYNNSIYVGHSDDTISISASGERLGTDGIRHTNYLGAKAKNSLRNLSFNLAYTPNEKLELRLGANESTSDVIYAGSITKEKYNSDPAQFSGRGTTHQVYDTNTISTGITYHLNEEMSIKADVHRERKESDFIPSFSGPSNYTYDSATVTLDYTAQDFSFVIGGDLFYGDKESRVDTTTKNNIAGFAMAQYYSNNGTFKAGYRLEKVSYNYLSSTKDLNQDDNLQAVELGYNYTLDKQKSFFVNYAHSYQAPSIDKFFATTYPAPTYIPTTSFNGFINPMKSDNYNIGFNYLGDSNKLKIALYYIDLTDEIYLYPASFKNTNISKSHKYGVDIYDKVLISNTFNAIFNYNYVQAIIDEEVESGNNYAGNTLPGVSDHNVKVTINYIPSKFYTFSLTQIYRSEAYATNDFGNDFTQKQEAYKSTDISLTYADKTYEFFAKINNVFNQSNGIWIQDDAIYPINFTTTAMAGMKLKF